LVDIDKNLEGFMVISFLKFIAKPKVSKPGPRFADVAGTDINKISPILYCR